MSAIHSGPNAMTLSMAITVIVTAAPTLYADLDDANDD